MHEDYENNPELCSKEIMNIRILCADIVQRANSGHPGAPIGLSKFIHTLYTEYLNLDIDNVNNLHRDIFILSNGHACVIQYVMNYLLGYLTLDDLKAFRKLNSKTPGHPEKGIKGIEVSTGPLGQGIAASVGFAISSKLIKAKNKVYCVFGDGCYQEGISQESFSLCSTLNLDNITFIYDFNKVTIDGSTMLSMRENVVKRFESLDFMVIEIEDSVNQIRQALEKSHNRPKLIIIHTVIGRDTENAGTCKVHGAPLGQENIKKLKEKYNFPDEDFIITEDLLKTYEKAKTRMRNYFSKIKPSFPKKTNLVKYKNEYKSENLATRVHLHNALNDISSEKSILCGCADLTPSVLCNLDGSTDFHTIKGEYDSAYIRFGIREHSMCGVMNGIASHGVFIPVGGTFLNFISYGFPSVRLAALDKHKIVYVLSHDSIGLGEDGPTHQPIEVLANLRATPNLTTLRPCDGRETRGSLQIALEVEGPVALITSRQKVTDLEETKEAVDDSFRLMRRGAYYLIKEEYPDIILMATGSEVELAYKVKSIMTDFKVSIVSFLSFELFEKQDRSYKDSILIKDVIKVSIEAMSTFGWAKYSDLQIGLDEFGRSAPGEDVFNFFGFDPKSISKRIYNFIGQRKQEKF